MRCWRQWVGCAVVCLSLIANSTSAVASSAQGPAPLDNGWLTLSMLTTSGSAALEDSAAAGQPDPAPPAPPGYTGSSTPPLPVILVWLSVLGADIYLLTRHDHHHHRVPNSPE